MKLLKFLIISFVLFSTLSYAKVVEGTFKLNQFRDNSGNSFDVEITVKYKIESLMGDPVVKATAKYEIGQFIDIDDKTYTKDDLTKEQRSKLKIYDLYITVPFDTTYRGEGTNTLYIDMSMGAMGSVGEWSFNPPESPNWDKWIYVNQYQYLTKEEAKEAYRGLKRLGYGKNAYDSLAMVKKIKYSIRGIEFEKKTQKQILTGIWYRRKDNKKLIFKNDYAYYPNGSTGKWEGHNIKYRNIKYIGTNKWSAEEEWYNYDKKDFYWEHCTIIRTNTNRLEVKQKDKKSTYWNKQLKDVWVDKETGLMWQDEELTKKEYNAYLKDKIYKKAGNWFHAKEYCQNLTLNDFNDWRLPTINELDEIKDKREHFKYKKTFRNIWSSSENKQKRKTFCFNKYDDGEKSIYSDKKNIINLIKCVRDTK